MLLPFNLLIDKVILIHKHFAITTHYDSDQRTFSVSRCTFVRQRKHIYRIASSETLVQNLNIYLFN